MLVIAQKLGFADLKSFRASLKTNPKLHPASGDALLDAYRGYLDPMQARLPQLFGRLPKAKFEVVPVPDYLEKTSAGAYYEPARPTAAGRDVYSSIPTTPPTATSTRSKPSPTTKEFPAITCKSPSHRRCRRFPPSASTRTITAYDEGWALYSERLGKDVGFYQDPYSDYGRLEADIWRAIRLVVDTGVHSQHWTRQQMVDYFHQHSAIEETEVQSEVDRYIAWPSQALAYKIGQLKILELREKAKKELGDKFDIRAFHDQVIDSGSLPLDVLDEKITAWIAAQKSATP